MTSEKLREQYLNFFKSRGHKVVPSSSLLPAEIDPTVLFTTAGMHQFKRYYAEPNEAPSARITTVQKCIRTGDIDEVGDETHGTFFEMLGNFSFGYPEREGSYFKKETIELAWEFIAKELKVERSRIRATYFKGERGVAEDKESLEILKNIEGLKKITPQGFDDNFWSLGTENSPGGPTVEFYIDDVEVWNLVFNEYVLKDGIYQPSKYKGVDTGMGLERLLYLLNNSENIYHTDLFDLPHKTLHELLKTEDPVAERIILDHIKASTFAINDGALPSNKGAGYVVRRLIRRAVVKAQQIGINENFTTKIAEKVFETYDGVHFSCHPEHERRISGEPVLSLPKDSSAKPQNDKQDIILTELEKEETKFRKTLKEGLKMLESKKSISGKDLFDLFQSFGIPSEISLEEIKRLKTQLEPDAIGKYEELYRQHQELSRTASAGQFKGGLAEAGEMTMKYHTATHLLLAALRQILGDQVFQKGSNITAERLRFDFSYPEKITPEQIKEVEDIVNEKIGEDLVVDMQEMTLDDARACGAMGVFENKYGEKVKVYSIGPSSSGSAFSREMCGGPHVAHTGELGHFRIVKEEASSAGVRRIKAVLE